MNIVLTVPQRILVEFARSRLDSLQVDIMDLDDQAMMTRLVRVMEIIDSKGMEGGLHQALAEYSDRFMDLGAQAGEMMVAAKGTRH
ncbi:hypothetical protein N9H39_06615 [Gammaproteobacteria bacterium]|nr:hypothetical protein [Gammaproteobacteria bacterium]